MLVNHFDTLGYPYDNLRSPETSKWAIPMGIRLSLVFEKIEKENDVTINSKTKM